MKLLFSTAPADQADRIAGTLLEERLVACVNMVAGVKSRYWWKGALEEAEETVMMMKTTDELVGPAIDKLVEVHPYEVPEAVAVEIDAGSEAYLHWIGEVTRAP